MKIDLHCHSKYSERPTIWLMRKIGCPESFTDPLDLYAIARRKGMDASRLPTTTASKAASISPTSRRIHQRRTHHVFSRGWLQGARPCLRHYRTAASRTPAGPENIFDLVEYLREHDIVHALAHPFYSVNDRLTGRAPGKALPALQDRRDERRPVR
jgi:hypothetical protein